MSLIDESHGVIRCNNSRNVGLLCAPKDFDIKQATLVPGQGTNLMLFDNRRWKLVESSDVVWLLLRIRRKILSSVLNFTRHVEGLKRSPHVEFMNYRKKRMEGPDHGRFAESGSGLLGGWIKKIDFPDLNQRSLKFIHNPENIDTRIIQLKYNYTDDIKYRANRKWHIHGMGKAWSSKMPKPIKLTPSDAIQFAGADSTQLEHYEYFVIPVTGMRTLEINVIETDYDTIPEPVNKVSTRWNKINQLIQASKPVFSTGKSNILPVGEGPDEAEMDTEKIQRYSDDEEFEADEGVKEVMKSQEDAQEQEAGELMHLMGEQDDVMIRTANNESEEDKITGAEDELKDEDIKSVLDLLTKHDGKMTVKNFSRILGLHTSPSRHKVLVQAIKMVAKLQLLPDKNGNMVQYLMLTDM